jgi:hypothetical protein
MKLPAQSAGLPGNDWLFNIVPLDPAHRAGLTGHAAAKVCRAVTERLLHSLEGCRKIPGFDLDKENKF